MGVTVFVQILCDSTDGAFHDQTGLIIILSFISHSVRNILYYTDYTVYYRASIRDFFFFHRYLFRSVDISFRWEYFHPFPKKISRG